MWKLIPFVLLAHLPLQAEPLEVTLRPLALFNSNRERCQFILGILSKAFENENGHEASGPANERSRTGSAAVDFVHFADAVIGEKMQSGFSDLILYRLIAINSGLIGLGGLHFLGERINYGGLHSYVFSAFPGLVSMGMASLGLGVSYAFISRLRDPAVRLEHNHIRFFHEAFLQTENRKPHRNLVLEAILKIPENEFPPPGLKAYFSKTQAQESAASPSSVSLSYAFNPHRRLKFRYTFSWDSPDTPQLKVELLSED